MYEESNRSGNRITLYGVIVAIFFGSIATYYSYKSEKRASAEDNKINTKDTITNEESNTIKDFYINNLIKSTEDTINSKKIGDFMNIINSDTAINSSIKVISDNGKDIDLNFQTDINLNHPYFNAKIHRYEVGEYSISNSSVQKAIINCFQSFYNNFKKNYDVSGSDIVIEICGNADGVKVFEGSTYEGDLGDELSISYYTLDDNKYKKVLLKKNRTLLTNEHFALLRGYVIKTGIENNFEELKDKIELRTKTFREIGPDLRSVNIRLKIINRMTLKKQIN